MSTTTEQKQQPTVTATTAPENNKPTANGVAADTTTELVEDNKVTNLISNIFFGCP